MAGGGGNEPNLTPLIDLFSVLIVFLLMTASWIQLESLQVQVEQKKTSEDPPSLPEEPVDLSSDKKTRLSVMLYSDRVIAKEDEIESVFGASIDTPGAPDLKRILEEWKRKYPENHSVIISTDASASYGQLIRLYDFVVSSGWSAVGISPY